MPHAALPTPTLAALPWARKPGLWQRLQAWLRPRPHRTAGEPEARLPAQPLVPPEAEPTARLAVRAAAAPASRFMAPAMEDVEVTEINEELFLEALQEWEQSDHYAPLGCALHTPRPFPSRPAPDLRS